MTTTLDATRGTRAAATNARPDPLALHRRHRRGGRRRRRRHPRPRGRQERRRARHDVRRPDQDDDRAGHLLHDRAGHRLGTQGRHRRQGRRAGVRLLPGDVHVRAGDRPRRRQPASTPAAACTCRRAPRARAPNWPRRRTSPAACWTSSRASSRTTLFSSLTAGSVLQALFVALLVGFALQAMGTRGRADPARHRAPAEAGVQGARR